MQGMISGIRFSYRLTMRFSFDPLDSKLSSSRILLSGFSFTILKIFHSTLIFPLFIQIPCVITLTHLTLIIFQYSLLFPDLFQEPCVIMLSHSSLNIHLLYSILFSSPALLLAFFHALIILDFSHLSPNLTACCGISHSPFPLRVPGCI